MNKKYNWFYIPLAIISFIVLMLHKIGPLTGKLSFVGFTLFTLLCVALIIENKDSNWKKAGASICFFGGLVTFLNNIL